MRLVLSLLLSAAVTALVLLTTIKTAEPTAHAAAAPAAAPASTGEAGGGDDDGNPIEGRRIFLRENCYICHGGRAGGGMCPSLREDPPDESDIDDVLEEGTRNGMPAYPHLRERDYEHLAAYFDTLRSFREPTFTHWWEKNPTQ
jgi:mono/diheme cytochrome c family protein